MWGYIQKLWGKGYGDVRQLGGPIKIAQISGDVAKMGLLPFIIIIAYISFAILVSLLFTRSSFLLESAQVFLPILQLSFWFWFKRCS